MTWSYKNGWYMCVFTILGQLQQVGIINLSYLKTLVATCMSHGKLTLIISYSYDRDREQLPSHNRKVHI